MVDDPNANGHMLGWANENGQIEKSLAAFLVWKFAAYRVELSVFENFPVLAKFVLTDDFSGPEMTKIALAVKADYRNWLDKALKEGWRP